MTSSAAIALLLFLHTCLGADFPCHAGGRARNRKGMQTYLCAVDGKVGHWPGQVK
ncbi:hypothetical protein DL89DRAFT_270601 [Linderina pennispora]|uniref:Uncharacterized protein n=1 Tax=Linderina pennispora TaxID=61395 RepID=A0A1Y1VY83_9FUNG|nr:uncharacterized protein DL89DRAFT_270601 [Linderina pennispora]ORX65774.1 hypothetical protein DL89DRAFT_270601 [Linderina pennispora]